MHIQNKTKIKFACITCHLSLSSLIFKRIDPLDSIDTHRFICLSAAGALTLATNTPSVCRNVDKSKKY